MSCLAYSSPCSLPPAGGLPGSTCQRVLKHCAKCCQPHFSSASVQVAGVAAQVLRQGVLQPSRAALAGGLRLHADLLLRFCAPAPKRFAAAQAAGEGEDEGEEGPSPASTEEEAGGDWTCGASISWWDPQAALAPALSLETLQASCDAALAAQQLLKTLLPLYAEAGQPRAAAGLLGTLCSAARCGSAAAGDQPSRPAARLAATLRSLSQLEGAVGALLQGCFPGSDWGQLPASAAEFGFLAGPGKGAGAAQGMGRGGAVPGRVFRSVRGRGRGLLVSNAAGSICCLAVHAVPAVASKNEPCPACQQAWQFCTLLGGGQASISAVIKGCESLPLNEHGRLPAVLCRAAAACSPQNAGAAGAAAQTCKPAWSGG